MHRRNQSINSGSMKGLSEDLEEWMKEVQTHCERCYDDREERTQVQEEG